MFQKLEEYFRPKKNIGFRNCTTQTQKQKTSTETFTKYVKDLKVIFMDCEYDNRKDILIDCIIYGFADAKLQEKLLDRGGGLTLSKALELGQQHHKSKSQLKVLKEEVRIDTRYKLDNKEKCTNPVTSTRVFKQSGQEM